MDRLAGMSVVALFALSSAAAMCQRGSTNAGSGAPAAKAQSQSDGNQSSQNQSGQSKTSSKTGTAPSSVKANQSGENAFPMAQSEAAAKAGSQQRTQQNSSQPTQKTASGGTQNANANANPNKSSPSQDNPFPEDQSKAAAKDADQQGNGQNSPTSQAGSSSSAGAYSSSDAHLPPPELGQGNLKSHEKMDSFTRDQTQDGRVLDDLKVADLYFKNGNYRGALLRYQDALRYDPQDDTALYGVANAMCKENLTAEAMARFKSYAKTNPQGKYAIKAEKMLAHPNKCVHNF